MLVQIGRRNAPTGSYQSLSSDAFRSAQARAVAAGRPMFAHLYVENRCHLKC